MTAIMPTSQQAQAMAAARQRAQNPDPWLTVGDIAADLKISKMTVYRATDGDYLRNIKVGRSLRIRTSWYQAWLDAGAPTYEADK